jgi:excisionase family DNA binding protein
LGVKPDTVLKWIRRGRLPAVKTPGGHHRIDAAVIDRLAAGAACQPPAPALLAETCWEFFSREGRLREECKRCVVYRVRARYCFEVLRLGADLGHQRLFCSSTCDVCPYYRAVHGQPLAVLVITPDSGAASLLQTLAREGLEFHFAANAYEASARIAEAPPVAVVLDSAIVDGEAASLRVALQSDPRIPWVEVRLAGREPGALEQELRAAAAGACRAVESR